MANESRWRVVGGSLQYRRVDSATRTAGISIRHALKIGTAQMQSGIVITIAGGEDTAQLPTAGQESDEHQSQCRWGLPAGSMQRRGAIIGILGVGHTDTGNDERRTLRQMLQSPMEGRPVALGQAGVKVGWEVGTELLLTASSSAAARAPRCTNPAATAATTGPRRRPSTRQTSTTNPTGPAMMMMSMMVGGTCIGHVLGGTVTHVADGTNAPQAVVDVELTGGLVALGAGLEHRGRLGSSASALNLSYSSDAWVSPSRDRASLGVVRDLDLAASIDCANEK